MQHETVVTPETLLEVLRGDQKEYVLRFGYRLMLNIGGLGSHPACGYLGGGRKEIFYTDDLEVLEELWNLLPPLESKVTPMLCYGTPSHNDWFVVSESVLVSEDFTTAPPFTFISRERFEELKADENTNFQWTDTVIGRSPNLWPEYIQKAIAKIKERYT